MKKVSVLLVLIVAVSMSLFSANSEEKGEIDIFLQRLSDALTEGDIDEYVSHFAEDLRQAERQRIQDLTKTFPLEAASFFKSHEQKLGRMGIRVFFQALYQSAYSIILETWNVRVRKVNDQWAIREKTLISSIHSGFFQVDF